MRTVCTYECTHEDMCKYVNMYVRMHVCIYVLLFLCTPIRSYIHYLLFLCSQINYRYLLNIRTYYLMKYYLPETFPASELLFSNRAQG